MKSSRLPHICCSNLTTSMTLRWHCGTPVGSFTESGKITIALSCVIVGQATGEPHNRRVTMHAFKNESRLSYLLLTLFLCTIVAPNLAFADDKTTDNSPTSDNNPKDSLAASAPVKPAPGNVDAPAPGLTERERWLLEEVEGLKRRVAELAAKVNPTAPTGKETSSATPGQCV